MKRFITLFCAITIMIFLIVPNKIMASETSSKKTPKQTNEKQDVYWPDPFDASLLSAESAILMDANTGLVLFEKNAHDKHYPASITKIMTSLLTLENASLGEVVTFSRAAALGIEAGSSSVATDIGEKLTIEQCLYAIMLESANEVCLGVAEHIAGSTSAFADMMNEKAKKLGCMDTHFSNPNGLHSDEHYTSAYDMALISQEALKLSEFRTVTATKQYHVAPTNKKVARIWNNHHQMVYGWKYPQFQYDYCIGGKTGYTQKAGNTLVTFAEKDGMTLIVVVMRATGQTVNMKKNQYTDTKYLFEYGFDNFTVHNLANLGIVDSSEDSPLFTKYNDIFNEERSPIHISDNGTILLPNGVDVSEAQRNITYQPRSQTDFGETIMGTITYTYNNKEVGSSNILCRTTSGPRLVAGKAVESVQTDNILPEQKDLKPVIIGILIGLVIIVLLIIYLLLLKPRKAHSYYTRKKRKETNLSDFFHFK